MFKSEELINYTVDKIYQYVSDVKQKGAHKMNFRCPLCGDSKQSKRKMRGWYNLQRGTYKCYNGDCVAQYSISALRFLSYLENKDIDEVKKDIISLNKNNYSRKDLIQQILEEQQSSSVQSLSGFTQPKPNTTIDIPKTWIDINQNEVADNYIKNRKIFEAPFLPNNWKLYYESEKNKIVIPWIRNNSIVYYQYRTLYKDDPVKYYFPEDTPKDIFGFDNIDNNFEYIFLIEGVFDTIFVKNGITIGGINLTNYQEELLSRYKFTHKLVYMFDNQWIDITGLKKSIERLQKNEYVFIWPKEFKAKDVNEYYLTTGKNPFKDEKFLIENIYNDAKGIVKLKFRR
jgi:hypothetical protein